jgi:carbonic anhydrase
MKTKTIITAIGLATFMMSCNSPSETPVKIAEVETKEEIKGLVQEVLTKEQQDALTPDAVITSFKDGNERFLNNDLTARDHSAQVRNSTLSQFPKAIVLSV